jgi:hypothetical protein
MTRPLMGGHELPPRVFAARSLRYAQCTEVDALALTLHEPDMRPLELDHYRCRQRTLLNPTVELRPSCCMLEQIGALQACMLRIKLRPLLINFERWRYYMDAIVACYVFKNNTRRRGNIMRGGCMVARKSCPHRRSSVCP